MPYWEACVLCRRTCAVYFELTSDLTLSFCPIGVGPQFIKFISHASNSQTPSDGAVVSSSKSHRSVAVAYMPASRSPSPERDVFGFGAEIVHERENKQPSTSSINFDSLLDTPLILHEDLQDGCGGQLWPAGMVLSKFMLEHHRDLEQSRIVEIGAGGGLVGLAVALGCRLPATIKLLITDQLPMLSLMEKNIVLNKLEGKVEALVYDWGTPPPTTITDPASPQQYPDIILAADCVYFEPTFPLLLQTLTDIIGPATICYFCFKKRRKADMRFIRDMLKRFKAELVEYKDREAHQREGIWLYKVTKKEPL